MFVTNQPTGRNNTRSTSKRMSLCLIIVLLAPSSVFQGLTAKASTVVSQRRTDIAQDSNLVLLNAVWERLLAAVERPQGLVWPPVLHVLTPQDHKDLNLDPQRPQAFATMFMGKPLVGVNQALMEQIIDGNPGRLGFVLGHELSHITLGHVLGVRVARTKLVMTVFQKAKELAADKSGMEAALRAGYKLSDATDAPKQFVRLGMEHPPLWPVSHPSWSQRLERMEKNRASLWKSMSAFTNGAFFLSVEQYSSAEKGFSAVVEEFDDCYEAHANLGYARLMQYCDLLNPDDVREFGIGHIVVGGFYNRPESLIERAKGKNVQLWRQAVASLEKALSLRADLHLAKATLGVAYLVRPEGKDLEKAMRYLGEAATAVAEDSALHPVTRASVLINLSVAELAAGKTDLSDRHLGVAHQLNQNVGGNPFIGAAIMYNHAEALLQSGNARVKPEAANWLNGYLKIASSASVWWGLGLKRYESLCSAEKLKCQTELQLRAAARQHFRPVPPVEVKQGVQVQLGDSMDEVRKNLGEVEPVSVIAGSDMKRMRYPKFGVDVIGSDQVVAVSLNSIKSPVLKLQTTGPGSQTKTLRVGMTLAQVNQVIGPKAEPATIFDPKAAYRFYPQLGIAAKFVRGRAAEFLVVLIPRSKG